MKKLNLLLTGLFISFQLAAQNNQTLDVVSWNIAWFGHSTQYPPDDNLQEANVRKILKHLDADLYALSEIVDTMRLRRVTDSLGSNFAYAISPFCSGNTTGTGSSWLNCQKLAFIYNKQIFTNVRTRGLMRNSATAYYNFASGRFPYMLSADVTINGVTRSINFILIHGKAGSTTSDYDRRKDGARELKDTLDAFFSTATNIIVGDYNDALDKTICSACNTNLSSYDPIIKDSTDGDHYISITLPLARAGQSSMTSYPNLIDNHVISNEAEAAYIPNSAAVRTDVAGLVVQYAATTSDHYPIISRFFLNNILTAIPGAGSELSDLQIFPNPFADQISFKTLKSLHQVHISIADISGRMVYQHFHKRIEAGESPSILLPGLSPGVYILKIDSREGSTIKKIIRK